MNEDGKVMEEALRHGGALRGAGDLPGVWPPWPGNWGSDLTEGGFCETRILPAGANLQGRHLSCAGPSRGPRTSPSRSSRPVSAAAEAGALLSGAETPSPGKGRPRGDGRAAGERPRIGVFVCHCGINISGVVNVHAVRDYAKTLPFVEYVTDNLFTCSTDTQDTMTQVIREKDLNRIVVAACTPKTHEPLFQETLVNAGLNKYLFEMTNIRNQDSWVHKDDPRRATEKAMDLVRMAVARVALAEPLQEADGGDQPEGPGGGRRHFRHGRGQNPLGPGIPGFTGGALPRAGRAGPEPLPDLEGEDIQGNLKALIESVCSDRNIDVHLNTELSRVEGFVGNFRLHPER